LRRRSCDPEPRLRREWGSDKSLLAAFSSEKEDPSFFEKKEAKKLLFLVLSGVARQAISRPRLDMKQQQ
jgi:hypothetical protein